MAQFPLMPKAAAIWLFENTTLTFDQIGAYTGLHPLEVQALADGEVSANIVGQDPILNDELTQEEIDKAQADSSYRMVMKKNNLPKAKKRSSGPRYTPISKRGDKPDAIAFLVKNHPDLPDSQIVKLIGTTKNTISKIRDRSHYNISNIKPRHPVELGLCTSEDLNKALEKAEKAAAKKAPKKEVPTDNAAAEAEAEAQSA
ncbi:MAG: cytoplasmic protein [Rickettsiales bacterium]|nr:cytoplasmic protein [Rickettsiales bacterium]|tara:strand:- start:129 stop:731 length:603 start_codon:yes stop_codon:yes gene_type:complete